MLFGISFYFKLMIFIIKNDHWLRFFINKYNFALFRDRYSNNLD